ncbi:DUF1236 domain-containing protein [Devosia sp. RR2S18]|jgi:hypothetical protein|uniref:DUF1236 domain-containing protein n=1 Tax=Devosia rhizosphaerae TaxID=3049774 RepID=UPI00253FB96B|nr:DUF1236 domain-containing protein [Devosia sp. RR2S18]WIJ25041.1 DUF1236 domain-containing protein [Devosia sp. RR2S18]
MKKFLLASVAAMTLVSGSAAFAQDTGAAVGAGAGGATGAVVGGLLGGPIGAVIGGFAGATIGAEAGVEATSVEYVTANPVEPIYLDGQVNVGYSVPADVTIHPIQGDERYGYLYANDRVWIADLETRALVQSPGYLVPQASAEYVQANPVDPFQAEGDVVVGYVLPEGAQLNAVPDSSYSYVYINDRPALVDPNTRAVIWIN